MAELERFIQNSLIAWRRDSEMEMTAQGMGIEELGKRIAVLEAQRIHTEIRLEELRNSLMTLEPLLRHLNDVLQQK
jgi:hypothetical protein